MKRCHLLCNAHLDPVWQWNWQEGAGAALSTFRAAANFCEETEGFVFNHNEAILYQWIAEYEPELFSRIKRLVEAGRWHIMGGWYLQPDCNMPSGESIARQILAGRTYFAREFHVRPSVAVNVDSFGHSRGLVQLLADAGYTGYLCMRPEGEMLVRDCVWKGFAGSEVLVNRCVDAYNSPLGGARKKAEAFLARQNNREVGLLLWGVGNHGGGPSRRDISDLAALSRERRDVEIFHSTPEAYFAELAALRGSLPVLEQGLNYYNRGCYTSQIRVKQAHALLENRLYAAEKMAGAAWANGLMEYPEELSAAGKDLMLAQFHDILPGSSVECAEGEALSLLGHGLREADAAAARAFFALCAGQPPAEEGEFPILAYNPHPHPVRAVIDAEFMLPDGNWEDEPFLPRVFQGGEELSCQPEAEGSNMPLDWRKRVVFEAELPAGVMSRFSCYVKRGPAPAPPRAKWRFQGARSALEIDPATGLIASYRADGVELLAAKACSVGVYEDTYDSWGTEFEKYGKKLGVFRLLSPRAAARYAGLAGELSPVRVIERGPVRTVTEALFSFRSARLCLRYTFYENRPELGLELRMTGMPSDVRVKLELPAAFSGCLRGGTMFGENPLETNGSETVAQEYVVLDDGCRALSLQTFGTYGVSSDGSGIYPTLLRTAAYSAYAVGRGGLKRDRFTPRMDTGERQFRFILCGGPSAERREALPLECEAAHQPPDTLCYFPSGGGARPLPAVLLDDPCVRLSCCKRAEDGNGMIVRLYNALPYPRRVRAEFPASGAGGTFLLMGYQFITCRVAAGHVARVNLAEEDLV